MCPLDVAAAAAPMLRSSILSTRRDPFSLVRICVLVLILVPATGVLAFAQDNRNVGAVKHVRAVRVPNGSIVVDGKLDETGWLQAPPADGFVQMQPREGDPATDTHQSEVRFVYDDQNLYIGATFHEDEINRLVTNDLKRDFPGARDGDLYVLILDTFHDRLNAYNFQTNPGCALRDSQSYDDGRNINANWDAVWTCRASASGTAWYVEESVPFKQLRFPQQDDQIWGVNMFRLIRHSNEQTIWNPTPRQFNQFKASYAGVLDGISGVHPGRNIRIKPFATGQTRNANGVYASKADGGLDVKAGLGTNLVLDGTWRTDFSQVEADAQQVNLTRFSLFFPEKREFFLENQGAFQIGPPVGFGGQNTNFVPFFSRTIGLSDTGNPIPVVGGLRLTGKVGRSSIAVLNMQVDREERSALPALPSANYSVVRYGREFLSNSQVGLFFLDKERGGLSNRLLGSDLRYYPTRAINVDALFMRSERTGADEGRAWRTGIQYDPGRTLYVLNYTSLGDTFRDELGFIPRQGVNILNADLLHRFRPRALAPFIREIRPELPYVRYTRDQLNPSTAVPIGVETQTLSPVATVEFSDSSTAQLQVTRNEELLSAPFRPQGIPAGSSIAAGRYRFYDSSISYNPTNSRRIAPSGEYRYGEFYDGNRVGYTAGVRVRASAKLATTFSFSRDTIDLPAGVSFHTDLASLRIDASFSTRMFLNAFIQYNSVTHQVLSNVRYDFIHHPLSDVFLVYNDTRFRDALRPTPTQIPSRALILKVTHLLSF
jgi:hypothetical protein